MLKEKININKAKITYKELPLCFNYGEKYVSSIDDVPNSFTYWYWDNGAKTSSSSLPEGYKESDFDGKNPCLSKICNGKHDYEQYSIQYPHIYSASNGLTSLCYIYSKDEEGVFVWHDMYTNDKVVIGHDECHDTEVEITEETDKDFLVLTFGCNEDITHGLKEGDRILFNRKDGDIDFTSYKNVSIIDGRRVYIENDGRIKLEPIACYTEEMLIDPSTPIPNKMIRMVFENHQLIEDRSKVRVRENFDSSSEFYYADKNKKRENGDLITFKSRYLYDVTGVTQDNVYLLGVMKNTKSEVVCYGTIDDTEHDITLYTPLTYDGVDSMTELLFIVKDEEDEELYNLLKYRLTTLSISCEDNRFFGIEEQDTIKIKDGFRVLKCEQDFVFEIKLESDGTNRLFQEQLFNKTLMEKKKEENVNPIIDYEKQIFIPILNTNKVASSIKFNLHFRERTAVSKEDEFGNVTYDYGTWEVNENNLWNNYELAGNKLILRGRCAGLSSSDADLLGYLGFEENDVYYRKRRLKQSFIRLSFYDKPQRSTQQLLYYSTIFINTGEEYGKLLWLMNNKKNNASGFTYDEGATYKEYRLNASFSAVDKYNSDSCSEGFYLYLFPDILDENGEATIYMKVEFNNAKYGVTVPFVMPMDENGGIIEPTDEKFPFNYVKEEGNEDKFYSIDMQSLHKDMYIEVKVKYDDDRRCYVYYFPSISGNEIVFNLFEPRLNRAKNEKACK